MHCDRRATTAWAHKFVLFAPLARIPCTNAQNLTKNTFSQLIPTLVSRRGLFPGVGINPIGFLSHGFLESLAFLAWHTSGRRLQCCNTLIASVRVYSGKFQATAAGRPGSHQGPKNLLPFSDAQ
jgi:hypothetical protein